jgi:membrane-associated phospholipid phosphatase
MAVFGAMNPTLAALRPVDRLLALFNVAAAILWLCAVGRFPAAATLCASHLAAVGLVFLSGAIGPRASRFGRGLRDLYPIVLVALYWLEIGLVRDVFHTGTFDALIARADLLLGGGSHLQEHWMPAMPWLWFSEIMFTAYWVYYPMVFAMPLVLVLAKRPEAGRVIFYTTLAYLACYVSYTVFPVDGPSHTMERFAGPHVEGFFYRLVMAGTHGADSMGTAFPSSHVVGAVTVALLAWKWFSRPWAVVFALGALGVLLSTVYTQAHFAIDSLWGTTFAVLLYAFVSPAVERWLAPTGSRAG